MPSITDISAGYAPGSICNIQPRSSPTEVDEFLEAMDLQSEADRPFTIRSTLPGGLRPVPMLTTDQPLPAHLPSSETNTTLRRLLSDHLDIRCSPRKSFFEWLRRLSTDEREQERLDEFIADPDEIHEYATRPSRSILETLHDFRETRIPPSHILEILPPLRRRQFSIASSWDVSRRTVVGTWLKTGSSRQGSAADSAGGIQNDFEHTSKGSLLVLAR